VGLESGGAVAGDLEHQPTGSSTAADLQLSAAPARADRIGHHAVGISGPRARALSLAVR
jgi:hypothetical protein